MTSQCLKFNPIKIIVLCPHVLTLIGNHPTRIIVQVRLADSYIKHMLKVQLPKMHCQMLVDLYGLHQHLHLWTKSWDQMTLFNRSISPLTIHKYYVEHSSTFFEENLPLSSLFFIRTYLTYSKENVAWEAECAMLMVHLGRTFIFLATDWPNQSII